ncbi:MAG: hypothetical protein ACRESZ_04665 [Methylococcales bacterium]
MLRIVLWILLLCPIPIRAGNDYFIDYLYIEAGAGNSSGGHAAIRFAEDVFHYQYFDGLLKAVRQNKRNFEYQYRLLGNRSIHVSRIAVREATYRNLLGYFRHKYRVQKRQFEGFDLIRKDIQLIGKLAEAGYKSESVKNFRYRIKGAALFRPANKSERIFSAESLSGSANFSKMVGQEYGPSFIADKKIYVEQEIAGLNESPWNTEQLQLSPDRLPWLPYSLAERFTDLLANLNVLDVLQTGASLNPEIRIESDLPEFRLNARQIRTLGHYRNNLQRDLLKLIASKRPDWGYPLAVGLARLMVLDESVQSGKLVLLDTFRPESERVDPEDIRRYRETFEVLVSEARIHFQREKIRLLGTPVMAEPDYGHLEMLANHYSELARGVIEGKPMRIHAGDLAPPGIGDVVVRVRPRISRLRLLEESGRLSAYAQSYSERLEQQYSYHLLTRNCVSEIFRDFEQALSGRSEAAENQLARDLGGTIDHSPWNWVPFISSAQVRRNLRLSDSRTLLSYRQKKLNGIYAAGNPMITYVRESNTLTSTVYPWNPDDGFFLFFTDDSILPRPLFGAINTVAGIGQMLVGGLLSPVDGGDVFIGGMKGFISSLPELAFFNIRKGSYRYQPFHASMDREILGFLTD